MTRHYTPWTWSAPHGRHYSYLIGDDGAIEDTLWSGPPPGSSGVVDATVPGRPENPQTAPFTAPAHAAQITHAVNQLPASFGHYRTNNSQNMEAEEYEQEDGDEDEHDDNDDEKDERSSQIFKGKGKHVRNDSTTTAPVVDMRNLNIQNSYHATQPQSTYSNHYDPSVSNPRTLNKGYSNTALPSVRAASLTTFPPASEPVASRRTVTSLPIDVQSHIGYKDRRFIQTDAGLNPSEQLDPRYRRVARSSHSIFFVTGRVFKMLWTEPAGQVNPGRTRNSTQFSIVRFGETAFSEIRRFVVVRNKGTFSQCIPIQTYKGQGATKSSIVMQDHGVIHTSDAAPALISGEYLTKYSIQVRPAHQEILEPQSRVNYGKAYAVEHNVRVLDIGMVLEGHRYLIQEYFDAAMTSGV